MSWRTLPIDGPLHDPFANKIKHPRPHATRRAVDCNWDAKMWLLLRSRAIISWPNSHILTWGFLRGGSARIVDVFAKSWFVTRGV